jgi:hypothetical protein
MCCEKQSEASQESQPIGQESNPEVPEYVAGMSTTTH